MLSSWWAWWRTENACKRPWISFKVEDSAEVEIEILSNSIRKDAGGALLAEELPFSD